MEWSDLRIFLAAVRAGSYTAAGRQLGINRTTVGRRIDALETALGVALFEETPLGPAPTKAGHRLLTSAAAIETEVDALRKDLGRDEVITGPIRIAGSGGIAVEFLPELHAFRRANPQISIELLDELDPVDAVTHRRADLGLAIVRLPPLRLSGVQVGTLQQAPYARRGAAVANRLGWGHEFEAALPGGVWTLANQANAKRRREDGLEPIARDMPATFNSWPQLKQAVLEGFGSAVLWCFAADRDTRLIRLAEPDARQDSPLWLIHRGKAPPAPGLIRLMDFLRIALAKRVAG